MKTYGKRARLFCDWFFSSKPAAICVKVLEPGRGDRTGGRILVRLLEGACKGEEREIDAKTAVPCQQEFRMPGSCFRWVHTNYQWA
jgi:hypothetical protein